MHNYIYCRYVYIYILYIYIYATKSWKKITPFPPAPSSSPRHQGFRQVQSLWLFRCYGGGGGGSRDHATPGDVTFCGEIGGSLGTLYKSWGYPKMDSLDSWSHGKTSGKSLRWMTWGKIGDLWDCGGLLMGNCWGKFENWAIGRNFVDLGWLVA